MISEPTVHYALNGSDADEEWSALVPPSAGHGAIHLGPNRRSFAVTMMHTLHCLDKMRLSIFAKPTGNGDMRHIEHCTNYVRELILCAADAQLEPVDNPHVPRVCRDWNAVYAQMERLVASFEAQKQSTKSVSS